MNVFENARFIKAQSSSSTFSLHDPLPFFRRELKVDKEQVKTAELFVQAPGFAVFYINGKQVTNDLFISPLSEYNKILWYNKYDVADLLCDGTNTIGVIAANGYFNENYETSWYFEKASWRDAPQFILSLKINGKDALVSDGEWRASRSASHIIFSHLRSGEYVDMRKLNNDWLYSGFDDRRWRRVFVRDNSEILGEFRLCECQPIREMEIIKPLSISKTNDGYLVDFGVNISGYMEITIKAHRGQEIIFKYCEEVDENKKPKHNTMDKFYGEELHEFQTNKLIASGNEDTFKPKFNYHGFRYVIIEGLDTQPSLESMRAYFTHNDVAKKSDFESGNDVINYIYKAGIRSTWSNMFWSLTDCPTREKFGWTNDAAASAEQALINFDILKLFKKWFEDIKYDQLASGEINAVVPATDGHNWSLDWGPVCDIFLFELPYRCYVYTGDSSMLTGAISQFENYINFLEKRVNENYEFKLGDWVGKGNSELVPKPFIRDFYFIKALQITIFAKKLAKEDYSLLEGKLLAFKSKFMGTYLDESGKCVIDSQTACAMMIMLGLYKNEKALKDQLVFVVERDGTLLKNSGMVGVQFLYDALTLCGRADLVFKMITENKPGFRTWYDAGATTLWELWEAFEYGSHNHHMFSNILAWFFKALLGICPKEDKPAFSEIELKPCFIKELGYAKGYQTTVHGKISAEWKYEKGGFTFVVNIPNGVMAKYDGKVLPTGISTFFIKE